MKTEHILVMRFSAIGDVAMVVPVVASLAKQYPHVRITVLSRPFARPFFDHLAPNVGFMAADMKSEYHGVRGLNALYRRLTAKQFTAVADLHNVLRSGYLRMRFNLGRYKVAHINKHRKGKRMLVRTQDKVMRQQPTAIENYMEVLEVLGYPVTLDFHSIFEHEGPDLTMLPDDLQADKGGPWIGIAPFAAHEGKVYPTDLMEQVVAMLCERHPDGRLLLFGGGSDEMAVFDAWEAKYAQCMNASKRLDGFRQELTLMSRLDVMLSMDSANMHLATLTATPVVSIFGATHPYAGFLGYGMTQDDVVQVDDLDCRPCSVFGNKPCLHGDYACMRRITPEMVVEKVEGRMKDERETPSRPPRGEEWMKDEG